MTLQAKRVFICQDEEIIFINAKMGVGKDDIGAESKKTEQQPITLCMEKHIQNVKIN